jgi:uncharacterized protein (DUF2252 family)
LSKGKNVAQTPKRRAAILAQRRRSKMARSAHAYVRGSTVKFYEWLESKAGKALPVGPPVWICGDCHVGNLGPVANLDGKVRIQIRDLDQTVIGNPVHDIIRLGLSLATAARSSDLPGVTTARMIEEVIAGYCDALRDQHPTAPGDKVDAIQHVMELALKRRWRHLAEERIKDVRPTIPRGDRFWHVSKAEDRQLHALFASEGTRELVTAMRGRDDNARLKLLDCAYWVKGCSSLGRLRFAALVGVDKKHPEKGEMCLFDIKEATTAAAPRAPGVKIPANDADRVVHGARALAPYLGQRMLAAQLSGKPVVVRELLPQDLKLEIDKLTHEEALHAARYLATVVGEAHARQMDRSTRLHWRKTLQQKHTKSLDAPSWFWTSVVDLLATHEAAYLDHCRRYPTAVAA